MSSDYCPKCESMNIVRSHRRGYLERWVYYVIGFVAMRCRDCKSRFYSYYRPLY
jgi:hypothetical protein